MNFKKCFIERKNNACYTQIDNEIVILNSEDGMIYHFNQTATDLWLSLESAKTALQLAQILADKYLEAVEVCQQDVCEWIEDTNQKGLLSFTD
ncbi:MAG: PqqD family protein [Gammaproteobacteria bacterium]|nr:PqqD family protein [Gammaproteobacteria bacterium]